MGQTVGEIDLGLTINQALFNGQIGGLAKSAKNPIVNAFKPIGKLLGNVLAVGSIVSFTKECLELGSDLTEVQNVADTTFKRMNESVNEFAANAMTQFGLSETVAKQYMGTLGAMSKSMGFSEQASYDMTAAVTGLAGDVASFYNLSTDGAFDKLKSIWTGETETLKSIGVMLTQTNLDQYALNNGFGKTTASMTEQEKVMLRYQYTLSALSDASGDFAKTSGSWANQTRILSLQFDSLKATLGQGFINLFTPIIQMINTLMSKLQALALQFKSFTEMLVGNRGGSESAVANIATDSESAVSGLSGVESAAKSAAKAVGLLAVDELNVLNSSDTSGTGTVSGATDISTVNSEAEITNGLIGDVNSNIELLTKSIEPFTSAIKRLWNEGLAKLGSFSITGLKDFYNEFLAPLGKWAFGTDDKGLSRLVNIINEDLCGVDWNTINKNLKEFWKAIEPYAEEFGEGLIDFFEDASDVAFDVLEDLFGEGGLLVSLTGWLNENDPDNARNWGYSLGVLSTALIAFRVLGPVIPVFSKLFTLFKGSSFATKISAGVSAAMTSLGGIGGLLTTDLAVIFGAGTVAEIGLTIGASLIGGIVAAIGGFSLGQWLNETITGEEIDMSWTEQFSTIRDSFSDGSWKAALSLWGEDISAGISAISGDLERWLEDNFGEPFGLTFEEVGIAIGTFAGDASQKLSEFKTNVSETFKKAGAEVSGWYNNNLKPTLDNAGKTIVDFGKTYITGPFTLWGQDIKDWWTNDVSPWFTKEKWNGIGESVKSGLSSKWTEFSDWWQSAGVSKWWNEKVAPWFTKEKWTEGMAGVKDGFESTFKNACNTGIDVFNKFIGWLNEKMNFSWDSFSIAGKEIVAAGSLQLFSIPQIPKLAQGGYVGANQPQLAVIGDNRHYGEIVSPEDKMYEISVRAMKDALMEIRPLMLQRNDSDTRDIVINVDGKEVFKINRKYAYEYYKTTGKPAFP